MDAKKLDKDNAFELPFEYTDEEVEEMGQLGDILFDLDTDLDIYTEDIEETIEKMSNIDYLPLEEGDLNYNILIEEVENVEK